MARHAYVSSAIVGGDEIVAKSKDRYWDFIAYCESSCVHLSVWAPYSFLYRAERRLFLWVRFAWRSVYTAGISVYCHWSSDCWGGDDIFCGA